MTHPNLEGLIPEIKRELLQAYVSGEHGLEYAITEAAQRIAALAALPGGGVDGFAGLRDYSRCVCGWSKGHAPGCVHTLTTAPTPSPHEADRK